MERDDDVRDGWQEAVKIFMKKHGRNGIKFTQLGNALLIIFKTNSSVPGSKVSKGFPVKEVSGQAVGFGGGKLFPGEVIRRHQGGRQSQTLKEEVKKCFC